MLRPRGSLKRAGSGVVLLNVVLLGAVAYFAFGLTRELWASHPLAGRPARQADSVSPAATADVSTVGVSARRDERAPNSSIAVKNLFSPSRTDTVAAADAPGPKPLLRGVVLGDAKSRAYLEDPASTTVFGYVVGDSVGGGRLSVIKADRVVIVRPGGLVEVLLRDSSKLQLAATVTAEATGAPIPPSAPGLQPTPSARLSPAPPIPLQSIPPNFLRRPTAVSQPEEAR